MATRSVCYPLNKMIFRFQFHFHFRPCEYDYNSSIQSIIIKKSCSHPPTQSHICCFMLFIIFRFQIIGLCLCVRVCVILCTVCKSFMCNNLTIKHVRFFNSEEYVFMFMFIFMSFPTYVQCEFHFSVLSVYFGVKSIEPKCPNEKKKKQQANQALPCKYVCRLFSSLYSFLFSVFLFFFPFPLLFFEVLLSLMCFFLCFSLPHHLVYHIENCCLPIFIRIWSYRRTHFGCCAAHFHCHTCGKTTHTLH